MNMSTQPRLPDETDDQYDIRINKDIAAFSYLWIMSVVIYMTRKESKFVRYHAKQGIVLFLLSIPISLIPFLGKIGLFFIVAAMLLGFVHAAQGQYADVPVVGDLAKGDLKAGDLGRSAIKALRSGIDAIEGLLHFGSKDPDKKTGPKHDGMDSSNLPPLP